MRILIINTLYSPYKVGGAEVSVQLLAEGLVSAGNQVRVLSLHEFNYIKRDIINGVEVCYTPLMNIYWPFKKDFEASKIKKLIWHTLDNYNPLMKKSVTREILDFKPDVVHTNNLAGFSVSAWTAAKEHNIRLIHTARDYYLFHPNCTLFKNGESQNPNELNVRFWSWVKKIKSKNVDYFVGISDFIRIFYIKNGFFEQEKSIFIYNSVNKIEKSNLNGNIETIGFIGGLTAEKGFDVFCDIADKYRSKYKFYAAGSFKNNSESIVLAKRAKDTNIILLGFVTLEDFVNKVDAVVLPIKWNEPFGRVVVECALSGLPIYTNMQGGISELVNYFQNIFNLNGNLEFDKDICKNRNFDKKEGDYFSVERNVSLYLKIFSGT